jgi:hypothetical protein
MLIGSFVTSLAWLRIWCIRQMKPLSGAALSHLAQSFGRGKSERQLIKDGDTTMAMTA